MANGSFGLSGLPTAPSTVGTVPNNALTPVAVAVTSTAGFQSGDLIYNYGGDIGPIPSNYASALTFPIVDAGPTYAQNVSTGEQQTPPVIGGYAYKGNNNCAKLTNGNIVLAYFGSSSTKDKYVLFKIIDENGNVVVAETTISSSATYQGTQGSINVCALTGGGFVVSWVSNNGPYPCFAIYSNTGTQVKAPTSLGAAGTISGNANWVPVYPRPDGSFVIGFSVGVQVYFSIYDSTGTEIIGYVNPGSQQSGNYRMDIAVRSDNSFALIYVNSSSGLQFVTYNSSGAYVSGPTNITTSSLANQANWGGSLVFSNDTILVTWGSSAGLNYATIVGNSIGLAQNQYSVLSGQTASFVKPVLLANGNYIIFYTFDITGNSTVQFCKNYLYSVFNSSHTLLTNTSGNYIYSAGGFVNQFPGVCQTANYLHLFYPPTAGSQGVSSGYPNHPLQLNWIKINPTAYTIIPTNSSSITQATSTPLPVNGYARASSTPTSATFLASGSSTVSATVNSTTTAATLALAQTTLDSSSSSPVGVDIATLANGTALVLYGLGDGSLKIATISTAGVLLATYTIATDVVNSNNYCGHIRIAVLSDGKIVCTYVNTSSSSTLRVLILSSAYSVLTTLSITGCQLSGQQYCAGIAALTNARFVVGYQESTNSYCQFNIYNSSGTSIQTALQPTTTASQSNLSVTAFNSGFMYSFQAGNNYASGTFYESSTNSWTSNNVGNLVGNSGSRLYNRKMVTGPNGLMYDIYVPTTTTDLYMNLFMPMGNTAASWQNYSFANGTTGSLSGATGAATLAVTGYGDVAAFTYYDSATLKIIYQSCSYGNNTAATFISITGISFPSSNGNMYWRASALSGHNVLLVLPNSSNILTYCIINPNSYTYSSAITAGVSASSSVTLSPARGIAMIGVSTSAAPANGVGTVQINGSAQLNSNYPTTTAQSFDFKNPVTFGASGVISGRNVNLIGNT